MKRGNQMVLDLDALEENVASAGESKEGLTPAMADTYIGLVKQNNEDIERFKQIYEERVKELKATLDQKVGALEQSNNRIGQILNTFAKEQEDLRTTKTKQSLELLSGTIEISRPVEKIIKPTGKKSETALKEKFPEHTVKETKVQEKFQWAALKKDLYIQDGKVYYTLVTDEDNKKVIDVTDIIPLTKTEEETKIV